MPSATMKQFTMALVLFATLALAGCANTIRGAGQDIEETVDATEEAAEDVAQ